MAETGLANILAFLSAAAGIGLATRFRFSHRQLCALISFAAGSLMAITCFHILPDAWAKSAAGAGIVVGFMAMFKILITKAHLPLVLEAIAFSFNYAFVL